MIKIIVAIEGVDGSGKTTQAKMLVNRLRKEGYDAVYVRPVYALLSIFNRKTESSTPVSPRKLKTKGKVNPILAILGYFYAILCYLIIRLKNRDKIIVCDRYFYQFFFDLFDNLSEKIIEIFPKPDVVFFLDIDINTLYSRVSSFDATVSGDYYYRVIRFYYKLLEKYKFIKINGTLDKQEINNIIFKHLLVNMKLGGDSYGKK